METPESLDRTGSDALPLHVGSPHACWWTATLVVAAFDAFWWWALPVRQPFTYVLVVAAAAASPAVLASLTVALLPRAASLACAAWAGSMVGVALGPAAGAVAAAAALLAFRARAWQVSNRRLQGGLLGLGVCWMVFIAPRLADRVPALVDGAPLVTVVLVGVFAWGAAPWLAKQMDRRVGDGLMLAGTIAVALSLLAPLPLRRSERIAQDVAQPGEAGGATAPHIMVLVLDTVRADRFGLGFGHVRDTTPRLDAWLARRPGAARFTRAYSNSNWTVPSHASLMTGLLPSEHQAHFTPGNQTHFKLDAERTLAEALGASGYRTVAVFSNPWLRRVEGMSRGFDVFVRPYSERSLRSAGESWRRLIAPGVMPEAFETEPDADLINAHVLAELSRCGDEPCFVLANYIEAHGPYLPEAACRGRYAPAAWFERPKAIDVRHPPETIARLANLYDEELCSLDLALDRLLRSLEERAMLDRTWLFITADHGESFVEHGLAEHGTSLYDEQVHVPLLVFPPLGAPPLPHPERNVSLVDIAATAAALGGEQLEGPGVDLRLAGRVRESRLEFHGDPEKAERCGERAALPARAVVRDAHKFIESGGRTELYDLATDASELHNLAPEESELAAVLTTRLPTLSESKGPEGPAAPLSPEEIRSLRALGYID